MHRIVEKFYILCSCLLLVKFFDAIDCPAGCVRCLSPLLICRMSMDSNVTSAYLGLLTSRPPTQRGVLPVGVTQWGPVTPCVTLSWAAAAASKEWQA